MGVYWAKPTLDDIAAQRAMIERGEEKRRAVRQAEERERLRDTFAAAALTGLLSNIPRYQLGVIAVQAYEIADEMIAEQSRAGKNHDAVPEARVQQSTREPERSLLAQSESAERGLPRTGNTPVLTDEERAALHWFAHYGLPEHRADTLRNLLERMK